MNNNIQQRSFVLSPSTECPPIIIVNKRTQKIKKAATINVITKINLSSLNDMIRIAIEQGQPKSIGWRNG